MKKYLMTGVAALALCAGFTACSNDEDFSFNENEYVEAQKALIEAKYQQAFVNAFGQPAKNHTWGFGNATTRATGEFANHIGAYPDANMWTSKGFLAPDPLTHAQKLRAQYYFQMNQIINPNRPDYGTKDFFMQQVYDGGTDPMAGKSLEVYPAADGSTMINSGEHMDHLTCGPDHTHTFNFNNGTCSTNGNVANRDQTDVNNTAQQHSDEIQLMLNTKTSCFGYANSDASCVRDDRWTLVSAKTIDDFCDGDANFATWLADKLQGGEVDKKCDDEFHRDFIGFDFDMIPDELIFSGQQVWEYGKPEYNYQPHFVGITYQNSDYYRYDLYGAKYHYLNANRNQYCGESRTIDPEPNEAEALTLLQDGWLPASGSANKTWVKVGGCNDGYYSDWIVTFKPADSGDEPNEIKVRILCEDMNADPAGEKGDFDFNDAVIDLTLDGEDVSTAHVKNIEILHTGAQFNIWVETEEGFVEIHDALKINRGQFGSAKTPVNFKPKANDLTASEIVIKTDRVFTYTNDKGEKITVNDPKSTLMTLEAPEGKAPAKILVGVDCDYPAERQAISEKYNPGFTEWVKNPNRAPFWRKNNND